MPQEVAEARPVAIDGGEFNRRDAEEHDHAAGKAHIKEIERRVKGLMQERTALQRKAKVPWASYPGVLEQEAGKKFSEIKQLQEQVKELKRRGARRRP